MSVRCSTSSVLGFFCFLCFFFLFFCFYSKLISSSSSSSSFAQVVNVLRAQLTKLDEIKKERETMESEIKSVTFDMTVTFLTALAQNSAINEEQLSLSQLEQLYGGYNQRVQASLRAQEELLGQVQVRRGWGGK